MAIPTEAEFLAYAECMSKDRLVGEVSKIDLPNRAEVGAIRDYVHEIFEARKGVIQDAGEMAASKWMEAQPSCARAYKALFGQRPQVGGVDAIARSIYSHTIRRRTVEEYSAYPFCQRLSIEAIQQTVDQSNSENGQSQRFRRRLTRLAGFVPWPAEQGIATSFSYYFYSNRFQSLTGQVRAAVELATRLREAVELLGASRPDAPYGLDFVPLRLPKHYRDSLKTIAGTDLRALPVQRNDSTARERCLAFDLWRAIYSAYGKSKPKAIAYFMEFEGVQTQPDLRELERRVVDWKARVPRYLIDPLQPLTAGGQGI